MKISKKAINAELPRVDQLRREYRLHNQTGWCPQRTTFASAVIDIDDGVSIRVYGVGDAQLEKDYYNRTIDISDIIEEWIGDCDVSRASVVDRIQECVETSLDAEEE